MRLVTVVVGTSCLLLAALFVALFAIAHKAAADEYYKGKTVTVYVGYDPGGTNDIVTRLVAAHIGPHLGGSPTVVVKNMPGAATRKLAAHIYTRAAKDGTEFGNIDRAVSTESLLDPSAKNPFDVLALTWIGSPTQETLVCVSWHTSKVQSVEDILAKDYGTSVVDLQAMLSVFGKQAEYFRAEGSVAPLTPGYLHKNLEAGRMAIIGVGITRSGAMKINSGIRHWLVIEDRTERRAAVERLPHPATGGPYKKRDAPVFIDRVHGGDASAHGG